MNERLTGVEDKVLERVRKLLRLARDGAATEAEAALAARRAGEIMEQHGLSTATVEAAGGTGERRTEERSSDFAEGRAPWMAALMRTVAESCFCLCEVDLIGRGRETRVAFRMFGRVSAVSSAFALGDYLKDTIWRLSRQSGAKSQHWFRSGCAERLGERVREGHELALKEQRERAEREAREVAARARHPGATATTGNLPAVVLADYALSEADLNQDMVRGLEPGTTAARRAADKAERDARDRRYKQLKMDGVDAGAAWNMVYMDMDRARAETYERDWLESQRKQQAAREAEAAKPREKTARDRAQECTEDARQRRERNKRSDPSWVAGREQADEVSLARQLRDRKDGRLR